MRSVLGCACALVIGACGLDGNAGLAGEGGSAGMAGAGGDGGAGSGGTAGSAGAGGSAGMGSVGGSGGIGGAGPVGGSGGFAGDCGLRPAPIDPSCADAGEGWFAVKTELDVWWTGSPAIDPGRGTIAIHQLVRTESVCSDGAFGTAISKLCGIELPVMTSDVQCEAYQLSFDDALWDAPTMPRFTTTSTIDGFEPGATFSLATVTRLLGIELTDSQQRWPTSNELGMHTCNSGTGESCFPDHDGNGLPGVTLQVRHDGESYGYNNIDESGVAQSDMDMNYGRCTQGPNYRYRGLLTGPSILGHGDRPRVITAHMGMRVRDGVDAAIGDGCTHGHGDTVDGSIEWRAWSCSVDPTTLSPGGITPDPRIASMDYTCTAAEAAYTDDHLPTFSVLSRGAMPPADVSRPNGWVLYERDIDKRPSVGTRAATVRLANASADEPTCAQVRAADYQGL